ncbi:unnamed protein product [Triticum turgidum subsp. durum]|uniref:Protein MEMO1 n=1 Tax=Triticum turgidum subsp. durum TaxID=4567 RepID=A0A9R1BUB6_TRITD|nr:unnamed protein product [Triticum turgidum subsp. durum]
MDLNVDEAEHSMEMHLPYLSKVFQGHNVKVVPILVGAVNSQNEAIYGQLLAKYVDDPKNFFSVSSDFCHWGSRCAYRCIILSIDHFLLFHINALAMYQDQSCFGYEIMYLVLEHRNMFREPGLGKAERFSYTYYDKKHGAIHKSIEALDRLGMEIIETGDPDAFKQYLEEYENTICGRHPISVLLHMLKHCSTKIKVGFVRYEQSSQCKSTRDSSVSYASAAAKVDSPGEEGKD